MQTKFQQLSAEAFESVLASYNLEQRDELEQDCQHLIKIAMKSPLICDVFLSLSVEASRNGRILDLFTVGIRIGYQCRVAVEETERLEGMLKS